MSWLVKENLVENADTKSWQIHFKWHPMSQLHFGNQYEHYINHNADGSLFTDDKYGTVAKF